MSDPVASRAATISLFGKSDQEVRFRVDDATFDLLRKIGNVHGMSHNEVARMKLLIDLYGQEHVTSLAKTLVESVAISGKENGK